MLLSSLGFCFLLTFDNNNIMIEDDKGRYVFFLFTSNSPTLPQSHTQFCCERLTEIKKINDVMQIWIKVVAWHKQNFYLMYSIVLNVKSN